MPVPTEITNNPLSYAHVWTGNATVQARATPPAPGGVAVPGRVKTRQFLTYIEVLEQGAHDPAIRSLVQARRMAPRPMHQGRVAPLNNGVNPLTYYQAHGPTVARIVGDYMTHRWTANPTPANTLFQQNQAYHLAVQAIIQPNGYSYEITMWYDVTDIYVAYHCYSR